MNYDITLKDLFQNIPQRLLQLLVSSQATELLTVEYPAVKMRRPDLVARLTDGRLYHLELQRDNDATMVWRMLEYYLLITQTFNQTPFQQVLYVGKAPLAMPRTIVESTLHFSYELIDIQQLDCQPLLASAAIEDNLLAILCRIDNQPQAVRAILEKIIRLDENAKQDALKKLGILAGLRTLELQQLINLEMENMPITIDKADNLWFQEGKLEGRQEGRLEGKQEGQVEGELTLLRRLMERRFGTLPLWTLERLNHATCEELETWGMQLLEAKRLEDIFN
ncbi:MAG: DUF4351 domain-containing protein [Thioploca sp.]|nr:DUF4351 domain-containing protein [Thioploca sp.]